MRAARSATALLVTALLVVGCGGSDVDYREVPGPPVSVPIPDDPATLGEEDADAADPDAAETPDAGATAPTDQTGSTDTSAATGTTDTGAATAPVEPAPAEDGGTAAPAPEDGPETDAPPPPGSEAEQFEDFCAQNPGAC